jgi:hypothetical protein
MSSSAQYSASLDAKLAVKFSLVQSVGHVVAIGMNAMGRLSMKSLP